MEEDNVNVSGEEGERDHSVHSLLQHLLSSEELPETNSHSLPISEQPTDRSVRRRRGKELWGGCILESTEMQSKRTLL